MAAQMFVHSSLASTSARSIRVVVCEPQAEIRAQIKSFLDPDPVLTLVAEVGNWIECEVALEDFGPELLIANSNLIPGDWTARNSQPDSFPVLIVLQPPSARDFSSKYHSSLPMPAAPEAIRISLNQAVRDIYDRKAKQLLYLIDRYIAASNARPGYCSTLTVESDGELIELPTKDILAIVAARKWVSIHTLSGQYILRESIRSVSVKLNPNAFVRIHRSIIINSRYVDSSLPATSRPSHAVMVNGSKYPVGPNYRDTLRHVIKSEGSATLHRTIS